MSEPICKMCDEEICIRANQEHTGYCDQCAQTMVGDVQRLLVEMKRYAIFHGVLIGECVAWNKLKEMFGVEEAFEAKHGKDGNG